MVTHTNRDKLVYYIVSAMYIACYRLKNFKDLSDLVFTFTHGMVYVY